MNVAADPDDRTAPRLDQRANRLAEHASSKKQVVYFYLSSAQEQTTVSKMAKLAMFSLLTAAARRGKGEKNRVLRLRR